MTQLIKYHGSYQQADREWKKAGKDEKEYSFMLRTKFPFGFCSPELYLALDRMSGAYGNGTLRATTRQTIQMHGIFKRDFRTVMHGILRELGSCLAACGDVNRNVMAP